MLRGLFGRNRGDGDTPRAPAHAWDLRTGDFLKLALTAPEGLSGAELQVSGVHAVDLGGPGKIRRVLTLDAPGGAVTLWREDRNIVAIGREILRADVEQLFDIDTFSALFDQEDRGLLTLERSAEPPRLEGWTTPVYREEGASVAYLHRQDPGETKITATLDGEAEEFDHYRLVGDRRRYAVEVAVFDGGRTDVTVIVLAPESIVEELWTA